MTDILVPLQQEEQKLRNPQLEHIVIIEKDLEKFHRRIAQLVSQWRYPRCGEFSIVLERWNVDLDDED